MAKKDQNSGLGPNLHIQKSLDTLLEIESGPIKLTDNISDEILDVLGGKETNKKTVTMDLPEDLLIYLKQTAQDKGVSVEQMLSEGIDSFLRNQYVGKIKDEEIEKILGSLSIEGLENEVITFMETKPSYFAKGSEAEIFKMHIPGKDEDVLVVKRKYKGTGMDEYDLHSKIKEIEILLNKDNENFVKIPSLFYHFNKDDEEYILMEYIEGQTLYLMIIEAIISQDTIKLGEIISDESLKKEFYYTYYSILKRDNTDDIIYDSFDDLSLEEVLLEISDNSGELREVSLNSDEGGENVFNILYGILKQSGIKIYGDPDEILQLGNLKTKKMIYDMINHSEFKGIGIFTKEEALKLDGCLNNFLNNMHDNGFYHRDLGNNTRNIILKKNKGGYIPTIIDFGKSRFYKDGIGENNPYIEENITGDIRPANDNFIVSNYISKLIKIDNTDGYKLIDKNKESLLKQIYNVGDKFNINHKDLDLSFKTIGDFKNFVFFDLLTEMMEDRKKVGGYEFSLSKAKNINIMKERESDNSKVLADILILIYFTKESNFNLIGRFIDNLEYTKKFNPTYKSKYISLYRKLLAEVEVIRN